MNMGIMHNCDTELLEESDGFFDIRIACDLVGLFTNDEDPLVKSKSLPEPKQVSDYPEKKRMIFTVDDQKGRAQERFLAGI